jgi:hypothetical protein
MPQVVHHHGELVGPVPGAIAQQQVAALLRRCLGHLAEPDVGEGRRAFPQDHPNAETFLLHEPAFPTPPRVTGLLIDDVARFERDVPAGAIAGVHPLAPAQPVQRGGVGPGAIALAKRRGPSSQLLRRAYVGHEAQPLQVLQGGTLVRAAGAAPVVVLDPEQHPTAERARDAPDPDRVGDVTEVQITSGTRSEAGERRCRHPAAQRGQIERRHGAKDHLASGLARPRARSYLSLTRPRRGRGRRTMTRPATARRGTRNGRRREYGG